MNLLKGKTKKNCTYFFSITLLFLIQNLNQKLIPIDITFKFEKYAKNKVKAVKVIKLFAKMTSHKAKYSKIRHKMIYSNQLFILVKMTTKKVY